MRRRDTVSLLICSITVRNTATLVVQLVNEQDERVDFSQTDNHDGTFTVIFTPKRPGTYTLRATYNNEPVPNTPLRITVLPHLDVHGIKLVDVHPCELQ